MPFADDDHEARYDEDGNIILPGSSNHSSGKDAEGSIWERALADLRFPEQPAMAEQELDDAKREGAHAELMDDDMDVLPVFEEPSVKSKHPPPINADMEVQAILDQLENSTPATPHSAHVRQHVTTLRSSTRSLLHEGLNQYTVSFDSLQSAARRALGGAGFSLRSVRDFLTQPVWVPGRGQTVKEYSRGTLFALDIVRFGGTFAGIFLFLFVALNYQSFWDITSAKFSALWPSVTVATPISLGGGIAPGASADGLSHGDLFAFLPAVGPPENRLVIPKLKLNIPLVAPPLDAMLRQDWDQVELDIQKALEDGVVHYPGTASPGQAGNAFITGHSSYFAWSPGRFKSVFARLHELNPGDEYWVYFNGDRHRYIVRKKKEVRPSDTSVLDQPTNKRISTLMTCTPVGTTLRRLIVIAEEVDPHSGIALQVGEKVTEERTKVMLEALPI